MPGLSTFSKAELAERMVDAVKREADEVRTLRAALKRIAELPDDLHSESVHIAKHALESV